MPHTIEKANGRWIAKVLTKRQERFCLEWFRHVGIARRAYVAAGYRARSSRTADANASRLLTNDRVRARIEQMQKRAAEVTADSLVSELDEIRQAALINNQTGAAVQAVMGKARITGHIIDRKETGQPGDFDRMNEPELRQWIADHTTQTDNTAVQLAEQTEQLNSARGCNSASDTDIPVKRQTHDGTDTPQ